MITRGSLTISALSLECPAPGMLLSVAKAGAGSGRVESSPAGVDCGADCSEAYDPGTVVTLTATADAGSTFAGWSGDADCADGSVTLDADVSCTASFDLDSQACVGVVRLDGWSTSPGSSYTLAALAVGEQIYTDRQFTITDFDAALAGGTLIRTANADKNIAVADHLTMTLCVDAIVYIARDVRATGLPTWMSGPEWSQTGLHLSSTDGGASPMDVYRADLPAGQVVLDDYEHLLQLGGNLHDRREHHDDGPVLLAGDDLPR